MYLRVLVLVLSVFSLPFAAGAADGTALGLETRDGYCITTKPVSEATFIYAGGIYAEDRHCKRLPAGPVAGAAGVVGYGPKLLAAPVPASADFWVRDQPGRITHACTGTEPLVMCLQEIRLLTPTNDLPTANKMNGQRP